MALLQGANTTASVMSTFQRSIAIGPCLTIWQSTIQSGCAMLGKTLQACIYPALVSMWFGARFASKSYSRLFLGSFLVELFPTTLFATPVARFFVSTDMGAKCLQGMTRFYGVADSVLCQPVWFPHRLFTCCMIKMVVLLSPRHVLLWLGSNRPVPRAFFPVVVAPLLEEISYRLVLNQLFRPEGPFWNEAVNFGLGHFTRWNLLTSASFGFAHSKQHLKEVIALDIDCMHKEDRRERTLQALHRGFNHSIKTFVHALTILYPVYEEYGYWGSVGAHAMSNFLTWAIKELALAVQKKYERSGRLIGSSIPQNSKGQGRHVDFDG